ncbi:MAG: RsmB/NOP family class I SAM-dependent RNA methyltransferase [Bacteroidota bacterium]|nr:RsmB/NOP family class I SAM-dependent RNA methyltransferase [Bacteroidota bacterium]
MSKAQFWTQALAPLPRAFVERLLRIGTEEEVACWARTFWEERWAAFRVNPLRAPSEEAALEALQKAQVPARPVEWMPGAYVVGASYRAALLASEPCRRAWLYVQNLSSMLPVWILGPDPEDRVLDLCAAPGGKTLQLAAGLRDPAQIVAVEKARGRYYKLRALLTHYGAGRVRAVLADGRLAGSRWPEAFDCVLLDAPCSAEARFRIGQPETYRYWSLRKVHELAYRSQQLLESALHALRAGGRLLFATCTFAPEENEGVLAAVLERWGSALELEPIACPFANHRPGLRSWNGRRFPEAVGLAVRVLPTAEMEGFFLALLRKRAPLGRQKGRR